MYAVDSPIITPTKIARCTTKEIQPGGWYWLAPPLPDDKIKNILLCIEHNYGAFKFVRWDGDNTIREFETQPGINFYKIYFDE